MEKKDFLLELFNAQREQLNKRRDIEWKVCISFWSALIIGTGFILKNNTLKLSTLSFGSIMLILVIYILIFISFTIWICKLWFSNEKDQYYINIYRKQLEDLFNLKIKLYKDKGLKSRIWWLIPEILITLFMILASFLLLITNNIQ